MTKDVHEFERLHEKLEQLLSQLGTLYQRGTGDILVMHDYYGDQAIGVVLLKEFPELALVRAARECLATASPGWEIGLRPIVHSVTSRARLCP